MNESPQPQDLTRFISTDKDGASTLYIDTGMVEGLAEGSDWVTLAPC